MDRCFTSCGSPGRAWIARPACGFRRDTGGAVAVEFAILVWPIILLILGALQLGVYQYTQVQLTNALFDTAADPEPAIYASDATSYKALICSRIRIMPTATCKAALLVEMARLADVPTTTTALTGTTFTAGASKDVLLLRAGVPGVRIMPLLPAFWAKGSVVFRRL